MDNTSRALMYAVSDPERAIGLLDAERTAALDAGDDASVVAISGMMTTVMLSHQMCLDAAAVIARDVCLVEPSRRAFLRLAEILDAVGDAAEAADARRRGDEFPPEGPLPADFVAEVEAVIDEVKAERARSADTRAWSAKDEGEA